MIFFLIDPCSFNNSVPVGSEKLHVKPNKKSTLEACNAYLLGQLNLKISFLSTLAELLPSDFKK
jgi:hypothetical protein